MNYVRTLAVEFGACGYKSLKVGLKSRMKWIVVVVTNKRIWLWIICLETRAKIAGSGGYSSREVGSGSYTP